MMAAIGALPHDALDDMVCFGEVGLDGSLAPAPGALPAAMAAHAMDVAFICPEACGSEATWAGGEVVAAPSLLALINHFRGGAALKSPERGDLIAGANAPDLRDVRGQEQGKRALEIAAAGAHNILFVGPPGAGKSMLAQRLPGLMPPPESAELLEVSMLILNSSARCVAPTASDRGSSDRAGQTSRHLSGAHIAIRRDESVPVRRWSGRRRVQAWPMLRDRLPGAVVGATA